TAASRLRRHEIKILVVAFDPVQRGVRFGIFAVFSREVAGAHPERGFGMPPKNSGERVEVTVKVADGAEEHRISRQSLVFGRPAVSVRCPRHARGGYARSKPCSCSVSSGLQRACPTRAFARRRTRLATPD